MFISYVQSSITANQIHGMTHPSNDKKEEDHDDDCNNNNNTSVGFQVHDWQYDFSANCSW